MKLKLIIAICVTVLAAGSCTKLDEDFDRLLTNPNQPSVDNADVDLFFNQAQLGFKDFFYSVSNYGNQLTRMELMFGPTYKTAYQPQAFDGIWTNAYANIFTNINAMLPLAEDGKFKHAGAAKIMKAYTMMTLVDIFGDVPYTEANKGSENTSPKADNGRLVYDSALALLDQAISDLAKTAPSPKNDLYYNGSAAKWTTLAKTLKLKAYVTTRLVDNSVKQKIQALLDENDLINSPDQDFTFKYGSQPAAPDSRHPKYAANYTQGGAGDYLGNYYMWVLYREKPMVDPRIRYYFYRQTLDIEQDITDAVTLQFTIPCLTRPYPAHYPPGTPFCQVGDGYIGRDHGNNEGIPPDNQYRTTWGVYPVAGIFDADQGAPIDAPGVGGKGQGIQPIMLIFLCTVFKSRSRINIRNFGRCESPYGIRHSRFIQQSI